MPIMTICPECALPLKYPDHAGAETIRCPNCGAFINAAASEAQFVDLGEFPDVPFATMVGGAVRNDPRAEQRKASASPTVDRHEAVARAARPRRWGERLRTPTLLAALAGALLALAGVGLVLEFRTTPAEEPTDSETAGNDEVANPGTKGEAPSGWVWLADLVDKEGRRDDLKRMHMTVDDGKFGKGIAMHLPSVNPGWIFPLDHKFTRFRGRVTLSDDGKPRLAAVIFEIFLDNKLAWNSTPLESTGQFHEFDIDVSKTKNLIIRAESSPYCRGLQAVWIEPMLKLDDKAP